MLKKYLTPDYIVPTFRDVTPQFCHENSITALICDIDNTLVTYDDPEPTSDVMEWFSALKDAGIPISFVSNNDEERVSRFNKPLSVPAYYKSGKPKTGMLKRAIKDMGSTYDGTVFLGDQLLTDVCAAKLLGLRAIVTPPIKDKKTLFFRLKRWIERRYIKYDFD